MRKLEGHNIGQAYVSIEAGSCIVSAKRDLTHVFFFKISNFSILVSRSRSNPSIRLPLNLQIHTCTQLQHTGNVHAYRFLSGKKWTEQERACDGGWRGEKSRHTRTSRN